jgi:hypothetical protein
MAAPQTDRSAPAPAAAGTVSSRPSQPGSAQLHVRQPVFGIRWCILDPVQERRQPGAVAPPARSFKNTSAVSTAPIFCATAEAIHWLSETPSALDRRVAASLIDRGSFRG